MTPSHFVKILFVWINFLISTIWNVFSIFLYFTRILKFFLKLQVIFKTILDLRTQLPIGASHSALQQADSFWSVSG